MTPEAFIIRLADHFTKTAKNANEVALFEAKLCEHHKVKGAAVEVIGNERVIWVKQIHIEVAQTDEEIDELVKHTCLLLRGKILAGTMAFESVFTQEDVDISRCAQLTTLIRSILPAVQFEELMKGCLDYIQEFTEKFPAEQRALSGHARLNLQRIYLRRWIQERLETASK